MSIGTNTPFGFIPPRVSDTGNSTFNTQQFDINPANTTPIGVGDLVKFDASGYVVIATPSDQNILGVFQGVTYLGTNTPVTLTSPNNWTGVAPASGIQVKANVFVDGSYIYAAQLSNAGVARSNLGTNPYCTFVAGTPNSTSGQSIMTVDSTSFAGSLGSLPLKLVGLATWSNGATQNDWGIQYNIGLFKLTVPFMMY